MDFKYLIVSNCFQTVLEPSNVLISFTLFILNSFLWITHLKNLCALSVKVSLRSTRFTRGYRVKFQWNITMACISYIYFTISVADIDECSSGDNACIYPSVCSNTLGSYVCDCPHGYIDTEGTCQGMPLYEH